jgi:hypothetical protein
VALSVPTHRRLDQPANLEALVRAIAVAFLDELETDALEWKGALDLTNRKSRFDLSRHLLGFGNRTVQQAQHAFDGTPTARQALSRATYAASRFLTRPISRTR